MRLHNAKYIGSGALVGAVCDGESAVFLLSGGVIRSQPLSGESATPVSYGEAYAPLVGGAVRLRGGKLVYERT